MSCGCSGGGGNGAIAAAMPALLAAHQTKVTKLNAIASQATPAIAADIRALITAEQPYLDDMAKIVSLGPSASAQALFQPLATFIADSPLGRRESAAVRRDLGLPPA